MRDLMVAEALVIAGLIGTGWVWRTALGAYGVDVPAPSLIPPFFIAQLGKYIPGSVWSFAAQGAAGARQGLSPRTSAAAAVLFLVVHMASGLVVVGVLGWASQLDTWLVALSLAAGLVGLVPSAYGRLGSRLAAQSCSWSIRRSAWGLALMVPVWLCYSLALVLLVPSPDLTMALTLGSSFAIAHAAGILVPFAPAGLGAREGVLALLLTPVLGVGSAAAVALVARLLHSLADFTVAGLAWLYMWASGTRWQG